MDWEVWDRKGELLPLLGRESRQPGAMAQRNGFVLVCFLVPIGSMQSVDSKFSLRQLLEVKVIVHV